MQYCSTILFSSIEAAFDHLVHMKCCITLLLALTNWPAGLTLVVSFVNRCIIVCDRLFLNFYLGTKQCAPPAPPARLAQQHRLARLAWPVLYRQYSTVIGQVASLLVILPELAHSSQDGDIRRQLSSILILSFRFQL